MKDNQPNGLIILVHDVLENIPETEILDALPSEWLTIPRDTIRITPMRINLGEGHNYNLESLAVKQEEIFEKEIVPVLKHHPDYEILYFGLAPIPLAVHLGYKIRSIRKAKAFVRHHKTKSWVWQEHEAGKPVFDGLPRDEFNGSGEAVIRMSTRVSISDSDVQAKVKNPLKEVKIQAPKTGRDIFGSNDQLQEYSSAFCEALDAISSCLSGVNEVHLFAAIPVGLAFLMGQEISPNHHPKVHVYEYTKQFSPPYLHAFIVNDERNATVLEISDSDRKRFKRIREAFQEDMKLLKENYIAELEEEPAEKGWFETVCSECTFGNHPFQTENWKHLDRLDQVELVDTFIQEDRIAALQVEPSVNPYYFMEDYVLKGLILSLKTDKAVLSALRMFCYHESLHCSSHGIHSESNDGMMGYPRMQEVIDYQADVYAMLHEFFCQRYPHHKAGEYFAQFIFRLTETMWAFEGRRKTTDAMEVQRVNRYLTWYFLACKLETDRYSNLEEVLRLIAEKPQIELRLHSVLAEGRQRIVYDFKNTNEAALGICVFHKGRVFSFGNQLGQLSLNQLVEGFRKHKPNKIKQILKAMIAGMEE